MTAPIALSCGEPAGIGIEIAARAWATMRGAAPGTSPSSAHLDMPTFFLIADRAHVAAAAGDIPCVEIDDPVATAPASAEGLAFVHHSFPAPACPSTPDPANASAVIAVIARAVEMVQTGRASALTTAPIHKKALIDGAGFAYPGHTEYLAALAGGAHRPVMMLAAPELRVVPVTVHIPLAEVARTLTAALLRDTIRITAAALARDFGLARPRIAVAGLNPHAGEGGAMGLEEARLIAPVLDELRTEGFDITGPLSADTMFHAPARARYDVAIAMYHDQALIPIKTLDFAHGVNVTLGLPFIRTSPDHGTAFDIAGTGTADPTSLIHALRMAHAMARQRGTLV